MNARTWSLWMAALALWAFTTLADAAESWNINALMRELAQVKSSKARFVERKTMSILNEPLKLSGTLLYVAPSHLEKHTLLPHPESMVLDGDKLVLEDHVRNRKRTFMLQDLPALWAFVESVRATLAGDLTTLTRFYRVVLDGNAEQWRLTLLPIDPAMLAMVTQIGIRGERNRIRTILVTDADGDFSEMSITEDTQ